MAAKKKKTAKKAAPKKAVKKVAAAKKTKAKKVAQAKPARKKAAQPTSGQSGPPVDLAKDKLNSKESRVVAVLAGDANPVPINALATNCFADQASSKANSWVRNSLRRLVRGKWVDKVGKGTYRLSNTGRALLESQAAAAQPA
jgi:outer membrane biosynthesis protein TonB